MVKTNDTPHRTKVMGKPVIKRPMKVVSMRITSRSVNSIVLYPCRCSFLIWRINSTARTILDRAAKSTRNMVIGMKALMIHQ